VIDLVWLNQALADPNRCSEGLKELLDTFTKSGITADLDLANRKDLAQEAVLSLWQFVKNGGAIPNVGYLFQSLRN
jgi:hypothetical protein